MKSVLINSNLPLVSVVITTHNRLNLLKRAVSSVNSQNYKNIELIVVDDHSDDGTKEWCQNQSFKYIYIPNNESKGGNYARNLGIKSSMGEYVAFLDDDDYWIHDKITKQVQLILSKDCALVYCGRKLEIVNIDNTVSFKDILPNPSYKDDMKRKILKTICCTTSTIIIKRQSLIDVGMFDENLKFWQEYELTIRLAQCTPFFYVNEPLTVYRIDVGDSNRLTNKFYSWKKAVSYIYQKHKDLYSQLSIWEKFGVRTLVWTDAKIRAKASGLHFYYIKYRILSILSKIYNLINMIINGEMDRIKNKILR